MFYSKKRSELLNELREANQQLKVLEDRLINKTLELDLLRSETELLLGAEYILGEGFRKKYDNTSNLIVRDDVKLWNKRRVN
jgi:hypothetical protein